MGIERMTFVDMNGAADQLDDVLLICMRTGVFQPESAARLSEYSIGAYAMGRNPYGALLLKINDVAAQLRLPLTFADTSSLGDRASNREAFREECNAYLNKLRGEYPVYFSRQQAIKDEIASYSSALEMLAHVSADDIPLDKIWENRYLKARFGRFPAANAARLPALPEKPYEMIRLDESAGFIWCLYFTAEEYGADVDAGFKSVGFERLRIPDFAHGTAGEAINSIHDSLHGEREQLRQTETEINAYVQNERERFLQIYSIIKYFHDSYDLRRYAVVIRNNFHLVGFVRTKDEKKLLDALSAVPELNVTSSHAGKQDRLPVPVKLKNNAFVRPFEMFVDMYGAPSYKDVDPTPFLAYTYTLLFGVMFGDFGHGLCVAVLGYILWRLKRMPLGGIMTRIGFSSMLFGFLYGSVFGYEHLLDGFFTRVMGLSGKPVEVLHPDTTSNILIVAVGLGAVLILSAIIFNIIIGLRQKNYDRALLSSNGVCGLVFYAAVLFGAIMTLMGNSPFRGAFVAGLIVLPLLLIFFREPIVHFFGVLRKDTMLSHDEGLLQNTLLGQNANIPEMFSSPFMSARFGRIPTDSYQKMVFYGSEPFVMYPIKADQEYIWLIYTMSVVHKEEIDAIFDDLYFERIYIPEDSMRTARDAEEFIVSTIEAGAPPQGADIPEKYAGLHAAKHKTIYQRLFPEGFGNFFTVTFFEMFEVLLSFISNTMSFLRVGGFILVHAGMMSVVMTLSEMTGGGGSLAVIVIGNVFVMGIEGLIVGIQVLRLEFYEMFSRFYGENGDTFRPVMMKY